MSMKYGGNVKGEKDACMREMDIVCRLSEAARRSKDMDARQLAAVNDFDLGGAVAAARQGDSASIKAACSVTVVAIDVAYSHYAGVTYHTQLPKLTSPRSVVVLLRNGVSYADLKAPRIKSHSTPCVSENGLNTTMSTSPTGAAMSPLCAEQDFTQRYNLLQELRRQYAQLTALVSSDDVCDYLMELYEGTLPTPSVGRAPSPPRTARSAKVVSDTCSDASSVKDRMGEARMKFLREKIDRDAQSIERRRAKERAADDRRRALREFMEKKNQRRNQKLAMFEAKRKENLDRQQRIKGQHDKEIFDRLVSSEQHINLTTALRQAKLKEIATLKQRREDEARRFLTEEMRSRIDEGEKHSQAEQERVARQHRYKLEVSDAKEQERRSQLQTHRQQTLLRCVGNEATRKTMCLAKRLETEQRLQRFHDEAQAEADQRTEQFQELEEVRNLKKEAVESWTRHHSCTLAERYSDKLSRTQKCLDRVQAQREACQQQALYRNSLKDAKVERMKQQMEYQRLLTLDRINDKTSKVQLLQDQRESDKREHQKMLMIQRKKQEMALRTRAQMSEPRDKAWFACCGVAACFVAGLSYRCFTRRASPFDRVNHLHPEGLIEVERKIEVDATLRDRIVKQGGVREGTVRIVDTYYDTWCFELCYQDAWLRRRNVDGSVRWEFKVGPGIASTKHTAASYTEYVEEEAFDKLREFLKHPFRDVSELLKNSFIQPLVRVATTRESYAYRGHTIDIDVTDEGHIVAEVEHVVKSRDQIPAARDSIDEVCRSLSIPDGSPPPPGKMEAALKAQRRDLLARLQALRQGQSA